MTYARQRLNAINLPASNEQAVPDDLEWTFAKASNQGNP